MVLTSIVALGMFSGGSIPIIGLFAVVIFYFISRAFYTYLRNDDFYKNTKNHSSDKPGEKYLIKGERDTKKIFLVVWILAILALSIFSLWMYSYVHTLN
jgi:hypothetical protein